MRISDWSSDVCSSDLGGSIARYYIAGSFNQDNGILKVNPVNDFNSNVNLRNYQLRSNININITKSTEAIVRLSGNFDDYTGPISDGGGMATDLKFYASVRLDIRRIGAKIGRAHV